MELYEKTAEHRQNNEQFRTMMARYSWMRPFQPSSTKAPWHIQVKLTTRIGYEFYLNFWPHLAKAQMEGEKSVEGWDEIRAMISRAIDACDDGGKDDFEVIE